MNRNTGIISVQFISLICMGLCLIFRTSTFFMAIESTLAIAILLIVWLPFRLVMKKMNSLVSSFVAVFLALGLSLIQMWVKTNYFDSLYAAASSSIQHLYLLFLVPMMVAQSHAKKKQKRASEFAIMLVFSVLMIVLGLVREFFGLGSIFSYDLRPDFFPTVWILQQPAGVSFILSVGLAVAVFIYRKYFNEYFQLKLEPESHIYQDLPRFRSPSEAYLWRSAAAFVFATVTASVGVVVMERMLFRSEMRYHLTLLMAVCIQMILTFLIYYFSKAVRNLYVEWKIVAFIIPIQTLIIVFPNISPIFSELKQSVASIHIFAYVAFVLTSTLVVITIMLFARALKQKLLFGHRPNSFEGIPLVFALVGMFLLIIDGFGLAIYHVLARIVSFG